MRIVASIIFGLGQCSEDSGVSGMLHRDLARIGEQVGSNLFINAAFGSDKHRHNRRLTGIQFAHIDRPDFQRRWHDPDKRKLFAFGVASQFLVERLQIAKSLFCCIQFSDALVQQF